MKIKKSGFVGGGLLGALGFSFFSLTIAMGAYKLNTMAINSNNVANVGYSEKALGKTLNNILSNQKHCANYLTGGGISVLKKGFFKNEGFIDIVDIEVKPLGERTKKIYVYYTKPALGAYQIRQGKDDNNRPYKCEPDDENGNKGDKRGCYHVSCEINFECLKNDPEPGKNCITDEDQSNIITSCVPNNCFPRESDSKISSCDEDKIKIGITPCETIPANIFDKLKYINPPSTETFKAFSGFKTSESRIEPDTTEVSKTCPAGQYPVRKTDGTVECQIMCTGGSTLNNGRCVCPYNENDPNDPTNKPVYKQGACHACPDNSTWDTDSQVCECPSNKPIYSQGACRACKTGQEWNPDSQSCECPDNKILLGDRCVDCTSEGDAIKITNTNQCECSQGAFMGSARATWNSETNECECNDNFYPYLYKQYNKWGCYHCPIRSHFFSGVCKTCPPNVGWNGSSCSCPTTTHYDYGTGECVCPYGTHFYNNRRCIRCPDGATWNRSYDRCDCSGGRTWEYEEDNKSECKCPAEKPNFYIRINQCVKCPSGGPWNGSRCACSGYRNWYWITTKCNCPAGSTWNGSRCNCRGGKVLRRLIPHDSHSHWKCVCPNNKPYYNTSRHRCEQCPTGSTWNGSGCDCSGGKVWLWATNTCSCPNNRPHDYAGRCNKCPQNQHEYAGGCHRCPSGQHEYGGGCHRCPSGQHLYSGNCITCPSGSSWSHNKCVCSHGRNWNTTANRCDCPDGRQWIANLNRCGCPSGQHLYSNRCITCPSGSNWNGSRCDCTSGKIWNTTANRCDCPSGKVESNGHCCPTATPHYYWNTCHECAKSQIKVGGRCRDCWGGFGRMKYSGNKCCKTIYFDREGWEESALSCCDWNKMQRYPRACGG